MNEAELNDIESALDVHLPESYRRIAQRAPFRPDSFAAVFEWHDDPRWIVFENRRFRRDGFWGRKWPARAFTFGHDGSGSCYWIDLDEREPAVHVLDRESGSSRQVADDLDAWANERARDFSFRLPRETDERWWRLRRRRAS